MPSHFSPATLRHAVGDDMFYSIVAELDPDNVVQWLQMVQVQATFKKGESSYDKETKTYSESMRVTLHWSLVYIFEDSSLVNKAKKSSGGLLGNFIRLHPTAFKANGACSMSPLDMAAVAFNTDSSMITPEHIMWLAEGLVILHPVAMRAARHVRALRKARGLPVTRDGFAEHSQTRAPRAGMAMPIPILVM